MSLPNSPVDHLHDFNKWSNANFLLKMNYLFKIQILLIKYCQIAIGQLISRPPWPNTNYLIKMSCKIAYLFKIQTLLIKLLQTVKFTNCHCPIHKPNC